MQTKKLGRSQVELQNCLPWMPHHKLMAECHLELSKYLKIPMTMMLMCSRMKERWTNKILKKKFRRPPSWQVFLHPTQKRSQLRNASKPVSSCRQGCPRFSGQGGEKSCEKGLEGSGGELRKRGILSCSVIIIILR